MGRTVEDELNPRIVVALRKITYPSGERLTRSFVKFDIEERSYNPKSDTINRLLPIIDHEYEVLLESSRGGNVTSSVDQFFRATSELAIVGEGLKEALAQDLEKDPKEIEKAIMETDWLKSMLNYIRGENRAVNKADPIKYAESVRQIVDNLGLHKAMNFFKINKIDLKRSALAALCRIANETPKIKKMILERKLKLTIAFELPNVEEDVRERLAEQIASFDSYHEQKDFLKKTRECR